MANFTTEAQRELEILEKIEDNPDETQASLAQHLGVAVGTINWHLKRMVSKGYIKVKRAERKKLRYIITPEGISLRARLAVDYIQTSFELYRLVRTRVQAAIKNLKAAGFNSVRLYGEGDVADVCRLTCFENGIRLVNDQKSPEMIIIGLKIYIEPEIHPLLDERDDSDIEAVKRAKESRR